MRDLGRAFGYSRAEVHESDSQNSFAIRSLAREPWKLPESRVVEEVLDQRLGAYRTIHDEADPVLGSAVEIPLVEVEKKLGIAGYRPERFLQIVRDEERKLFQIFIRPSQFHGLSGALCS